MGKKLFTSDLHLGHKNIIKYCGRPFLSEGEMFDTLVANFRAVVQPGDELYILGDISFEVEQAERFLRLVPGQKFIAWGNHDPRRGRDREALSRLAAKTGDILETKLPDGTLVVMCHYPMLRWNRGHFGSWMLHGHTHGECTYPSPSFRILDVGVDQGWDEMDGPGHAKYFPWSEDEVRRFMSTREAFKHHYHPSAKEEE